MELPDGEALSDADDSRARQTSLVLERIEALEDRVAFASIQQKGWKPPRATAEMNSVFRTTGDDDPENDRVDPFHLSKEMLLSVESASDRRYHKAHHIDCLQSVVAKVYKYS